MPISANRWTESQERHAYNDRGVSFGRGKGQLDKAIADFNESLRLDPKYARAYCNRGLAWNARAEYDKALADFNEALRLTAKDAYAYGNRGHAWDMKGEYDKAIADFSEALRFNPTYGYAYVGRGYVWQEKGEYDKAIADFNEALRLDPKDAYAYVGRGCAREDQGEYDKAVADFNRALAVDPNFADGHNALAWSKPLAWKRNTATARRPWKTPSGPVNWPAGRTGAIWTRLRRPTPKAATSSKRRSGRRRPSS